MKEKGLNAAIILIAVAVFVIIGSVFLFFQQKNRSFTKQNINDFKEQSFVNNKVNYVVESFPKIETSSFQSYPIAEEIESKHYKLTLIPLHAPNYVIKTGIDVESGPGSAMNVNITEPIAAPDLKVTAFLQNGNLLLISADGKNKVKLPDNLIIESIAGWSPDSKKLLVYSGSVNIETIFYGLGELEEPMKFSPNRLPAGFYLVDIETSTVKFIYPLTPGEFLGWINNDEVIFALNKGSSGEQFLVFNVNTFIADAKILKDFVENYKNMWTKDHISFSRNGQKWAIGSGNMGNDPNDPSISQIFLADFPSPKGNIIVAGKWADFQSPFLSPSGKNLAYTKTEPPSGWHLIIWSGYDKVIIENSRFKLWIDDNSFIYAKQEDTSYSKYYLYNLLDSKSVPLN